MIWLLLLSLVAILYALKRWSARNHGNRGDLDLIPGPTESPWVRLLKPSDKAPAHEAPHLATTELARKYGPIFKLELLTGKTDVVVCSYELIYKVLVSSGKLFGGRSTNFRLHAAFDSTGIAQNVAPDEKWRLLRRIPQRHLRQFGDGLSRLENIIVFVAEEMFREFDEHEGKPFNPKEATTDAARSSIAFLISGEKGTRESPLVKKLRLYEEIATQVIPTVSVPLSYQLLDVMPWLRFLGLSCWKTIQKLTRLERVVWNEILEMNIANPSARSICKLFQAYMDSSEGREQLTITTNDARKSSLSLLLAGVVTTSTTLYAAINILAHHPEIQERLYQEIVDVVEPGEGVTLTDRNRMHYCRGLIYEVLRYHSLTSLGVAHRACEDTTLGEYSIPAGTRVVTALYLMHHDEEFWGDPYEFRPERFLDENEELVPADHPNRKHLMPFGAGTRVCLGESLALTRLFLWISNMVLRYTITPAPGNAKSSVDPRNFRFSNAALRPPQYEIIFSRRQ